MKKNIHKLIVLDLDGTSARYEPCLEMDPVLIDYFRSVRDKGVSWVINSDRYTETLIEIAGKLSPEERPAAILGLQRFIYLLDHRFEYVPCKEWNDEQMKKHLLLWNEITPFFDQWQEVIEKEFNFLDSVINDIVFAYRVPTENIDALRKLMRELIKPFTDAQVSGNNDWSFMLHRSFSKASVLADLAVRFGVSNENIIAIGDGLNDISMLNGSVAKNVGCPANASDEVRETVNQAGGRVSGKDSAEGTLEIIKYFLEKKDF